MTTDRQEAEKKAQALLKFALGNHNAKRYGEAAGFYEAILQRHPDTEAAQYALTNLESLVNLVTVLSIHQGRASDSRLTWATSCATERAFHTLPIGATQPHAGEAVVESRESAHWHYAHHGLGP